MQTVDLTKIEQELAQTRTNLVTDRLDMSFGEIMNIYQDGDIIISPEFQRLFRWSDYQKTRFIESVLLGIPIPPIFVSEDKDGKWELVDGLQRLSTILSFFGILKKSVDKLDEEKNNWLFTEGDIISSLQGKRKEDLPLKLQIAIKRAVCRVELLRWNEKNNTIKYELFNRLNTGGSTATEQEIRNCIFRGTSNIFNDFLKKQSENTNLAKLVKPSKEQIEQLYLEELVLRFVSLFQADENTKPDLTENISKYMTQFMKDNVDNDLFPFEEMSDLFSRVLNLLEKLKELRVFRGEKGPFSTNIFDVIMLGIAHNLDYYESNSLDILRQKVSELKNSGELKTTSSGKVSSKNRNLKRIELAKNHFRKP